MASYDSGTLTNKSKRSARIFSDLNLDFVQNPATKDIQKIEDVDAVKRSVRNLINTNYYERPFRPSLGSNLRAMLFELFSPQMNHAISKEIDLLIRNYEPRVGEIGVEVVADPDQNELEVKVLFEIIGLEVPTQSFTFLLEPTR